MTFKRPLTHQGFSLIEMLVVISIIALITSIAMPTVSSYFQVSINSATRDLATIVKEAYNAAVVTGRVHRVVYDLKKNEYWVEAGPPDALLDTKETKEKAERRKRFSRASAEDKEKEGSPFALETTITRKKMSLPRGVTYEDVLTQQATDPINDGTAYTHFFSHGLTEQTIIHLQDQSKHHASLVVTPMIGNSEVYDRYVNGAEIFEK
jgi:prepilin-type N-terminal cleavage/methylation domain-containing protein